MSAASDKIMADPFQGRLRRLVGEAAVEGRCGTYTLVVIECCDGDSWDDPAGRTTERFTIVDPAGHQAYSGEGGVIRFDLAAYEAKIAARRGPPKPPPVITPDLPRVAAFKCPDCEGLYDEPGEPCWECSRCGQIEASDERRCGDCNVFRAKVAPGSCPHCGAAHEDGAETVLAVRPDGYDLVEVEA